MKRKLSIETDISLEYLRSQLRNIADLENFAYAYVITTQFVLEFQIKFFFYERQTS